MELFRESADRVAARDRAERLGLVGGGGGGGLVSPAFTAEEKEAYARAGLAVPRLKTEEVEDEGWMTGVRKFENEGGE